MSSENNKPANKPKKLAKPAKPSKPVPVKISDTAKPEKTVPIKTSETPKPAKVVSVNVTDSAKPSKDTVYIDNDDEITAIIDKVEASKADNVALVLPKRAQVLQSIVNMRLLKRSADEASKQLVLVTNESAVIPLAGAAGVNVAKNLQAKPYIPASPVPIKSAAPVVQATSGLAAVAGGELDEQDATLDYHRSMGELAVNEETDEPETIKLAEDSDASEAKATAPTEKAAKTPKDKKLQVPNFDRFRKSIVLLVVGLIVLIISLIFAAKVLPKATITVQTTGTPVSANFTLTTSDKATALDQTKMVIPVTNQTKDQTSAQSVQATGTQNNGTKASGSVTLDAPCTSYSKAPPVGGGSVAVSGGLNYVMSSATKDWFPTVNGGICVWEAKFNITATQGGANYNQTGSFTVKGYADISGSGSAKDGADNNVQILTQADVDKAKAAITSQSSDAFSKDFQKKLADQGLYVIASTLKIAEPQVTATPGVGQPASTAQVSIKITYSALTVKKDDLKTVVSDQLKKKIDTSKQQILDADVLKNVVISVQNQTSPVIATLNVTADASTSPNIDVNSIKKLAAGKKAGEIRDAVSGITGVKSVDVKMSPFWVTAVPASKIKVNLQQVQASQNQNQSTTTNAQP